MKKIVYSFLLFLLSIIGSILLAGVFFFLCVTLPNKIESFPLIQGTASYILVGIIIIGLLIAGTGMIYSMMQKSKWWKKILYSFLLTVLMMIGTILFLGGATYLCITISDWLKFYPTIQETVSYSFAGILIIGRIGS